METIIVELTHSKALKLLEELEEMEIIKLHPSEEKEPAKDKASKYRGFLTKESGEALDRHVQEVRNEWEERDFQLNNIG